MIPRERRRPRPARVLAAAAAIVVLATALAGCASPVPSLSSDEAIDAYGTVLGDVRAVLEEEFPDITWSVDGTERVQRSDEDGPCRLVFASLRSSGSVVQAAGGLDAALDVISPVLEDHGFSTPEEEDIPGGWLGGESTSDDGAVFEVDDKGYSTIALALDVSDEDCPSP